MSLSESQKKHLRGLGHGLKPLIMIGDGGLTDSVYKEFESTLAHHELLKVRVRAGDRQNRDRIIADLCSRGQAELVTKIGNVALLFRRNEDKPQVTMPRK